MPKDGRSRGWQTCRCGDCKYRCAPDSNRHFYSSEVIDRAACHVRRGASVALIGRTMKINDSLAKLTKEQLAELGYERFSIAKSELLRLSKNRARKRILAALKIERTMQGVAEQARRAGMMRSA